MVDYKNQEIANKIKPFTENICITTKFNIFEAFLRQKSLTSFMLRDE